MPELISPTTHRAIGSIEARPVCGSDFCDCCGDCIACFAGDCDGRWLVYEDELADFLKDHPGASVTYFEESAAPRRP